MRKRTTALLALPLLLAGCAGADARADAGAAPAHAAEDGPSETATMVCHGDVQEDITRALALPSPPPADSTWADPLFTCTYDLPAGPLTLEVEESPDRAAAAAHFDQETAGLTPTVGLGERSATSGDGTVVVVKDDVTLTVDATALPEVFGDNAQRRGDFAYEVASIVLGCWTRHS